MVGDRWGIGDLNLNSFSLKKKGGTGYVNIIFSKKKKKKNEGKNK